MPTSLISGKALWGVICGSSVLPSDEVVTEELQIAVGHLKSGLSIFKPWSDETHKSWCDKFKLKDNQKKFVEKLGKLLDLCSEQAWEMFQLFLQHEYRGSTNQLASAGTSVREETHLLHQMWSFFLSDPLHLLSCLRHLLMFNASHPYRCLFMEFVKDKLDSDHSLGSSLMKQLQDVSGCDSTSTGIKTKSRLKPCFSSPHIPPRALYQWVGSRLGAMKHLLATLIIYYARPDRQCSPDMVLSLLKMAQGGGLSQACIENIEGGNTVDPPRQLIEAINALHSLLLVLVISKNGEHGSSQIASDSGWVSKFDTIINTLGSRSWHLPALLAWSVRRNSSDKPCHLSSQYQKLAERAIKGDVFTYLQTVFKNPCIETDELLTSVTCSMLFTLICNAVNSVDLERLGCITKVTSLAHICLTEGPPAEMFWSEEEGMVDLLLPRALENFPQEPNLLLTLVTTLATANPNSSSKVIELLSDLPNFHWTITDKDDVSMRGFKAIAEAPLQPLPGLVIPMRTVGALVGDGSSVVWQFRHSGWQFIQIVIKVLEMQISNGVLINDWLLSTVVLSLKLLTAVITTQPSQLPALINLRKDASSLLVKVSQISKPNYTLVASLLEFFAEVSKQDAKSVWADLDESPLLPSYQMQGQGNKKWRGDGLLGYKAGNTRALVCIDEKSSGNYPILRSLCTLLSSGLQSKVCCSSVRGGVVFVVREVIPEVLGWCMASAVEQVKVLLSCLSLLHNTLDSKSDPELHEMVTSDLVSGCGRATLRALIEHGAQLEASLDQPSQLVQWPHSSHTKKMSKVAKSSLSLLHKLLSLHVGTNRCEESNKLNMLLLGTKDVGPFSLKSTSKPSHLALTVARYTHNRLDPHLPYLSLQTLTTLAEEVEVPLVACLGAEAEGIKDSLLTRLDSSTEDLRIKVSLLKLLKASTIHQPGLLRLFLTPLPPLLDPLTSLLQTHYEGGIESEYELMSSMLEFLAALWGGNYATATAYLRNNVEFWRAVTNPLYKTPSIEINSSLISYTLQLLALEYFVSQVNVPTGLQEGMNKFTDTSKDYMSAWSKFILKCTCDRINVNSKTYQSNKNSKSILLTSWRDFLVVVIKRSQKLFTPEQLNSLAEDVLDQLLVIFENVTDHEDFQQSILTELHLSLINNCTKQVGRVEYIQKLGDLLSKIRVCVMKVSPKCQILILAAALKCLTLSASSDESKECASKLVEPVLHLVGQHCNLARGGNTIAHCSTPGVLSLATQLLHHCFLWLPSSTLTLYLLNSSLISELATTGALSVQDGNFEVVENILSLFSHIARNMESPSQLTTQSLAETISLSLVSQENQTLMSELVLTVVASLDKEGVLGVEGAVSIAAVHLEALVAALHSPHYQPLLAHATCVFIGSLVPHSSMWRVNHQYCYTKLVSAVASCVHITTHLLSLPVTLEKEMGFKSSKQIEVTEACKNKTLSNLVGNLLPETINLVNQLLQILCSSLRALRGLGPDLTDLLCRPGLDLSMWLPPLIQPSFRRISTDHPATCSNLATLSAILDLYHTYAPKEGRGTSPSRSGNCVNNVSLNIAVLSQCAEEALYLLMSQSGLVLISGQVVGREAREIRNFLADETNTFFSHWIGRKTTQSPVVPQNKDQEIILSSQPDHNYLKLAKHIVDSLYRAKLS